MEDIDELRERLPRDLERLCEAHGVPGAAAAVLIGDDVAHAEHGAVNSRTEVPTTPDSLFMIQSITKLFTATLVMQLVDDGLLCLDDAVRSHLSGFRTADPDASGGITIRHLLTHSGGFEGDLWAPTTCGDDALEHFVVDLVSQADQHSKPGTQFSYCNAGFGVLGRLVEVHRGITYETALRRYVAEPLGIDELAFSADQALAFRTAIGHVRPVPSADLGPLRNWAVMPASNPAAGNQLAMSARGLLAFARMHVSNGLAPDGTQVLSAESAQQMRKAQIQHPPLFGSQSSQGLGWWLNGSRIAEHGGGSTGIAAKLRIAPAHGLAAVVLTNAEHGERIIGELLPTLFADLVDSGTTQDTFGVAQDSPADLTPFVGHYNCRQTLFDVALASGHIWLTRTP
ncbi:MAG: serine hydrolase domain-containing protein, partial [Thermomicrobiales bacterium]